METLRAVYPRAKRRAQGDKTKVLLECLKVVLEMFIIEIIFVIEHEIVKSVLGIL